MPSGSRSLDQEAAGLSVVCDGELRRRHYIWGFLDGLTNTDTERLTKKRARGGRYSELTEVARLTGPVSRPAPIFVDGCRFARAHTTRQLEGDAARSDDGGRLGGRRGGERRLQDAGDAVCRDPQPRGARSGGRRRRRHPVRRALLQHLPRRSGGLGHRDAGAGDGRRAGADGRPHLLRLRHAGRAGVEDDRTRTGATTA